MCSPIHCQVGLLANALQVVPIDVWGLRSRHNEKQFGTVAAWGTMTLLGELLHAGTAAQPQAGTTTRSLPQVLISPRIPRTDDSEGEVTHTTREGAPAFRLSSSICVRYQWPATTRCSKSHLYIGATAPWSAC